MSHADKFRSSNASISKEDWERIFGEPKDPDPPKLEGDAIPEIAEKIE